MKIKAVSVRPTTLNLAIQCYCTKLRDRIDCYHVHGYPNFPFKVNRPKNDMVLEFGHITQPGASLPQGLMIKLEQMETSLKRWNYLNQGELVVRFSYFDLVSGRE